jgi:hypothetical protein
MTGAVRIEGPTAGGRQGGAFDCVLATAARPAVAPAPRTRRPHIGTRARPRPEDRLPPATRWPAGQPVTPRPGRE